MLLRTRVSGLGVATKRYVEAQHRLDSRQQADALCICM